MTITTNDDRDEYTATASQTVFNYTFKIFASTDLNVYQTPAGQTANDSTDLITAYTVSGVGSSSGGTITLTTPASAGDLITIVSDIPSSRTTDYQVSGDFVPATVNNDFDRMVSLAKQAEGLARRSLLFEESQQGVQAKALPKPDPGKIFSWDESGNVVYRSITDVATPIDINSTIDVYPHMADFITRTPTKDIIYVESYAVWSPGVTTPKGAHFRYKTGGTNTAPTVGSPVAVSTIGTGTQAGYAWTADGVEWRISDCGRVALESFGFLADWNGSSGTSNADAFANALASGFTRLFCESGRGSGAWFGNCALNTVMFESTTNREIDWNGLRIVVTGDNSGSSTDSAFLQATDSTLSMHDYEFEDTGFSLAGPSRGVMPVKIINEAANTSGYSFGNFNIVKGQSILTAASSDPLNYRAKNIKFWGYCNAEQSYYGVNLVNSGDDFDGDYTIGQFNRAIFVYGVENVRSKIHAITGQASTANVLISSSGASASYKPTKNIFVDIHIGEINGAIAVASQTSASGGGEYENIRIKAKVDAIGSNLTVASPIIVFGAFASGGGYETSGTVNIDYAEIDLQTDVLLTQPVQTLTTSSNYGILDVTKCQRFVDQFNDNWFLRRGAEITKLLTGAPNTLNVDIPGNLLAGKNTNALFSVRLIVNSINNSSNSQSTVSEYYVFCRLDSSGNVVVNDATQVNTRSIGGVTPTVTIAASTTFIRTTIDTYTFSTGYLKVTALKA